MTHVTAADPAGLTPTGAGVVLVCSGGGLHGATQAGMLAELVKAGFTCDAVVGVSAGACNGTYLAADWSPAAAEALCEIWGSLTQKAVFPTPVASQVLRATVKRATLHRPELLRALIERLCPVADLADTVVPVHVGATDVATGDVVWFRDGPAVEALQASTALPGVFPTVNFAGYELYDGGVAAALPLQRGLELGARAIVALDLSEQPRSGDSRSVMRMIRHSVDHTRWALREAHIALASRETHCVVIRPEHVGSSADLAGSVEYGRTVMREFLAAHPLGALEQAPAAPAARPRRWRRLLAARSAGQHTGEHAGDPGHRR
jgi:NTE family protein